VLGVQMIAEGQVALLSGQQKVMPTDDEI